MLAPNSGCHVPVDMTSGPVPDVQGTKNKPKTLVVNTARVDPRIRSPPARGKKPHFQNASVN